MTALYSSLAEALGEAKVRRDEPLRAGYARDTWPKLSVAGLEGKLPYRPDLVVRPESEAEVAQVVKICRAQGVPVVPYAGGTGVCGGAVAARGGVALDLKQLNRILDLDETSQVVTVEAGVYGVDLENWLNRRGFSLNHFPASLNASTVGGYLACRSAGQASSRYGKIEDMVLSLRVVLPDGRVVQTKAVPRMACGPDWNQLFVGAEGTLGIITQATLHVHRLPEKRVFLSYTFKEVDQGILFLREVMQRDLRPAILRLYDPLDSFFFRRAYKKGGHEGGGWRRRVENSLLQRPQWLGRLLSLAGAKGCIAVAVAEGSAEEARFLQQAVDRAAADCEGRKAQGYAEHFYAHRFAVNFFLPRVLQQGVMADTMEVVALWKDIPGVYHRVMEAMGKEGLIFAHFSHAYLTGCCIYFSFVTTRAMYDRFWERALRVATEEGSAVSHHHGVGLLKKEALARAYPDGQRLFGEIKSRLDPQGIMNPGKLYDEA